jgi:lipoprotein-anchoring transpeptidase ErfK/SrfK
MKNATHNEKIAGICKYLIAMISQFIVNICLFSVHSKLIHWNNIMKILAIVGCVLLSATLCHADSRNAAIEAITVLQQAFSSPGMSTEEIANIKDTFSTAEHYLQQGDHELSERYYLITIQKTRVLMSSLPEQTPGITSHQMSEKHQPASPTRTPAIDVPPTGLKKSPPPPTASQVAPNIEQESEVVPDKVISNKLVGNTSSYTVKKKDSLRLIAAKLGVSQQHLIQMNHLEPKPSLKPGQTLKYNNRKIIPRHMLNGIVINIPDRTLYYFKDGKLASSLPVALGVGKKGLKYDWTTPTGKFKIVAKQKDPTWHVPQSIQSEMEGQGKEVITSLPPGPRNPLGKYAIKTSLPGILIHSTTKPGSIYSFASHGCIRVYPEQMAVLFKEVKVNTPGEIIYLPVKLAVTEEGRVFLEVHRDAYNKNAGLQEVARQLIEKHNISDKVDWNKVKTVIRQKAGLAVDVTL